MSHLPLPKNETLAALPREWPQSLLPDIRARLADGRKLVVLDDDPTGTQTVHNVPVLTQWPVADLRAELEEPSPVFYILTNSRSLPLAEAQALNRAITSNLRAAADEARRDFVVVSRSDSTLRGHYPGEVDAVAEALEMSVDATLIIPFFLEGGRYTIGDVHYVAEGDQLIPAADTPFAADAAFGYRSSNLREWVEEKSGGRITSDSVASLSLEDIRHGGPERILDQLRRLENNRVCIVNAAAMRDLEVVVLALLMAEVEGKRFLYRTAASFVQVRAGLSTRPLLTRADLMPAGTAQPAGGLFVVGSYVPKTTGQLYKLLEMPGMHAVEVDVEAMLDPDRYPGEIERAVQSIENALANQTDTVLYTSRRLISSDDAAQSLAIGKNVSAGLVEIVKRLRTRPRYLVAKGGITSSDIATQALGIRRGLVLGQILPGVPVWQTGPESAHPGMPYIVFPGNVGGDSALVDIYTSLRLEA